MNVYYKGNLLGAWVSSEANNPANPRQVTHHVYRDKGSDLLRTVKASCTERRV